MVVLKEELEKIEIASKQRGWSIVNFVKDSNARYVVLQCNKEHKYRMLMDGHKYPRKPCSFCEGKHYTLAMFTDIMSEKGYTIVNIDSKQDVHGNTVVTTRQKVTFKCSQGHEQTRRVSQCLAGEPCTICSGTVQYNGFSRSEEIIARVLTYYKIDYIREHLICCVGESLRVDFYLPDLGTIIEYDGKQHKLGRPQQKSMSTEERKRRDNLRDDYALANGLNMIRIGHNEQGNRLIQHLCSVLPSVGISLDDPYVSNITRSVYNEASTRFGWTSYEELERIWLLCTVLGKAKTRELTGMAKSYLGRVKDVVKGKG